MTRRDLRAADIRVFSEAVRDFFATLTSEHAEVRSAYVLESEEAVLWNDFNGLIEVDGGFSGCIAFSAPRGLLTHVLLRMGDQEFSEASHCDVVGEIANILSGSARRHFGEGLRISPPTTLPGRGGFLPKPVAGTTYAIPLRWNGYEADLVVSLASAS